MEGVWKTCSTPSSPPAERDEQCGAIIKSGQFKQAKLAHALSNRGIARAQLGNFSFAMADFDEALRHDPDSAVTYYYRGTIWLKREDLDRALADLDKAIALDPKNSDFYYTRARIRGKRNDHLGVIADYSVVIGLAARPYREIALRGYEYEQIGEREKAIADYQKSLEIEPEFDFARRSLHMIGGTPPESAQLPPGKCSENDITHEERIAGCTAAIDSGKITGWTLKTAYCNRGYALTETGEYDRVIDDSNKLIGIQPKAACAYLNRGRALYFKREYDRAIADYTQTIKLDPEFHEAYANRGTVYHARQDYKKAVANYDAAIRINPDIPMYFSDRGNSRFQMGDNNRAIADLTHAIEMQADYADAYARRGWVFLTIAELDRAEADFAKALELEPGHAYARTGREQLYKRQGKTEQASAERAETKDLSFENFRRLVQQPAK